MSRRVHAFVAAIPVLLSIAVVAGLVYAGTSDGSLLHTITWWIFGAAAFVCVLWRAASSAEHRRSWLVLAAGVAAYLVGDVLWDVNAANAAPNTNTAGNGCYLLSYVLFAGALATLPGTDRDDVRDDLLDTGLLLLAGGAAAYIWGWLPLAALRLDGDTRQVAVMTLCALSLALVAGVRALMSSVVLKSQALALAAAGVVLVLVADLSFFHQAVAAGWGNSLAFNTSGWDGLYLLGWLAVALGALLPSAGHLTPTHEFGGPGRVTLRSLAAVTLSMVVLAAAAMGYHFSLAVLGVCVAVVVRLWVYVVLVNRRVARMRTLRDVSGELGASGGGFGEDINGWLDRLGGSQTAHLRIPGAVACPQAVRVLTLGSTGPARRSICVHSWVSREAREDVESFARMLTLAYERETLRARLAEAQFQTHLSTWLEHTTDVLLAVRDSTVIYASPAAYPLLAAGGLGTAAATVTGRTLTELGLEQAPAQPTVLLPNGHSVSVAVSSLPDDDVDVWTLHDITEQERMTSRLQAMAYTDPLTGAGNRQAFVEALVDDAPAWIGLLDVDDFKATNDTWGHPGGDEVLVALAARLRGLSVVRHVFRLGGDEFAVFLHDTPGRFGDILAVATPVGRIAVSVTVGIAPMGETVVRDADAALYAAKRTGKGAVRVHTPAS